jgi:hypothetical protein
LPKTGHNKRLPEEFRKYFWDVDYDDLSLDKYPKFIAERIMNYGDLDSVKWLQSVLVCCNEQQEPEPQNKELLGTGVRY